MKRFRRCFAILAVIWRLGARRVALLLSHRLRLYLGCYVPQTPCRSWDATDLPQPVKIKPRFVLHPVTDQDTAVVQRAERILAGELRYFSGSWKPYSLILIQPVPNEHWSSVDLGRNDIKWLWEPGRFQWSFDLLQAWWSTGDSKFRQFFWDALRAWAENHPPNTGVQWSCGQECAIRLVTLALVGPAFGPNPEQSRILVQMITALAERIEPAIRYALSQRNNHSLSESLGLYMAGLVCEEHPKAPHWRKRGREIFIQEAMDQFAEDGSYVLNSFNYQREALRLCWIFVEACRSEKLPIPESLRQRLRESTRLLFSFSDRASGRVPQYGHDDGTDLFAIGEHEYSDFRPALQTLYFGLERKRLFQDAASDRELCAYYGAGAEEAEREDWKREGFSAEAGGYFRVGDENEFAMIRCHTHQARPGQADMLHCDLWADGVCLLGDGGTYAYVDNDGIGSHLKSTAAHNTWTLNGKDQMVPLGTFLWGNWTRAQTLEQTATRWSGEHYGYLSGKRGWIHRRTIEFVGGDWVIWDQWFGRGAKDHVVGYWHLNEGDWKPISSSVFAEQRSGRTLSIWSAFPVETKFMDHSRPMTLRSPYLGVIRDVPLVQTSATASDAFCAVTVLAHQVPQFVDGTLHWAHGTIGLFDARLRSR